MTKTKECGEPTQIMSRVNGYYRPVQSNWNRGKQEEFKERKTYDPNKTVTATA